MTFLNMAMSFTVRLLAFTTNSSQPGRFFSGTLIDVQDVTNLQSLQKPPSNEVHLLKWPMIVHPPVCLFCLSAECVRAKTSSDWTVNTSVNVREANGVHAGRQPTFSPSLSCVTNCKVKVQFPRLFIFWGWGGALFNTGGFRLFRGLVQLFNKYPLD